MSRTVSLLLQDDKKCFRENLLFIKLKMVWKAKFWMLFPCEWSELGEIIEAWLKKISTYRKPILANREPNLRFVLKGIIKALIYKLSWSLIMITLNHVHSNYYSQLGSLFSARLKSVRLPRFSHMLTRILTHVSTFFRQSLNYPALNLIIYSSLEEYSKCGN